MENNNEELKNLQDQLKQHINDSIRNVFTMTGFYRLFTIND